jgi:hypothetical protein
MSTIPTQVERRDIAAPLGPAQYQERLGNAPEWDESSNAPTIRNTFSRFQPMKILYSIGHCRSLGSGEIEQMNSGNGR